MSGSENNQPFGLANTLDDLRQFFTKYATLPEHAAETMALWTAHTFVAGDFYTTPRIVLSSAVPGSGKTRVLELLGLVVYDGLMVMNASTAAIFRSLEAKREAPPTIMFDEIDAIFGPKSGPAAEDLRALLNSGYKAGASVLRCEGDKHEPVKFPTFAPVAMAGLAGHLPDTLATRSIIVEMKKHKAGEKVAKYRERRAQTEVQPTRDALAMFMGQQCGAITTAEPDLPAGVEDRAAEVWEPLIAIADAAGGDWPEWAREACKSFVFKPTSKPNPLGIELLSDIRDILTEKNLDRMRSVDLLEELKKREDSPWGERDEDLTPRRLSRELGKYNVKSVQARLPGFSVTAKCYISESAQGQDGLADAFSRYLPPLEEGDTL